MLETSPEITLHIYSTKRNLPPIGRDYGVYDLPIHSASLSISYLRQTRQIRKWAAPPLVARVDIGISPKVIQPSMARSTPLIPTLIAFCTLYSLIFHITPLHTL